MKISTVILAAGAGTRMKSSIPKVLHNLMGKPLIAHVAETASSIGSSKCIIVLGNHTQAAKNILRSEKISFALQKELDGTAGALRSAMPALKGFEGDVLILSGDTPLITPELLKKFIKLHRQKHEDISVMTFEAQPPHAYGRIVRSSGKISRIVEDRDATPDEKLITEVNSGIYLINPPALKLIRNIPLNKAKGEYYLTDIISIALKKGLRVGAHMLGSETELTGINTRAELQRASLFLRDRIVSTLMQSGVTFIDASTVFISKETKIGQDTIIYPNVHIEGESVIGRGCIIYPNSRIIDSSLADNVVIKDSTLIESSKIKSRASVGPFAHLRPGSVIGSEAKIGNFVEIKKSIIGKGSKASHLTYLGDAVVGNDVNIGAGTITCNYDGVNKYRTDINDNVFIGSDSQLVAPVTIGKGAYVGAGSTITHNVPPGSLAISRTHQKNIKGWAKKKPAKGK
ncbi:MAG: bifunctional UDP-N-acetylglucosamine diphosphorylase/glucosamine-1-phosphate N-acetyltransferase GlmU [Dissulfurispiraceae bacterium]|jgi:bifunctional UDP-N-acetylglucosamine pyrophosphorylase/glucosamine-1-phosphate N-acetyltransferase|nr:bifunctional UDP-N-acetylglucosamine diphosphorylase/glucosamine-1-phosphate N-acetyltransferase GlmU [Dissulfurispiraceae bacterium]